MNITVTFVGVLGALIGEETVKFHFCEQITCRDLLAEMWRHFASSIPDFLWDDRANSFKDSILILGNGRYIESPETLLVDGEEIKFMTLIAGG